MHTYILHYSGIDKRRGGLIFHLIGAFSSKGPESEELFLIIATSPHSTHVDPGPKPADSGCRMKIHQ